MGEMERTVTLLTEVFAGTQPAQVYLPSPDHLERKMLFSRDALTNPEHLRFALKGCLAASSCYVIYNALAWPGISTAVTTPAHRLVHKRRFPPKTDTAPRRRDHRGLCYRNGRANFRSARHRLD